MKHPLPELIKYFFLLTFLLLSNLSFSQLYYRSVASGDWAVVTTWESAPALAGPWTPATSPPGFNHYAINIRVGHTVTMNSTFSIDEVTIDLGGFLVFAAGAKPSINDGPGVDLTVNGTITESTVWIIAWAAGSTWQMGPSGSLIRNYSNIGNWQNNYQGGIATIPSTSNWILRRTLSWTNPQLENQTAVYPNLIIENTSGFGWFISGINCFWLTNFATIKGNFDLGGSGTGLIDFADSHFNVNPTLVLGDLIVRASTILRNGGTGFEVRGNVTINGTVIAASIHPHKFIFSGGNAQTVSGTGTFGIDDMQVNKSTNDVTLNRTITIRKNLDLVSGIINSTLTNLVVIDDNATVTNTSNISFVRGPVRKLGDEAFIFPVGKYNDYQAIGMGIGAAGADTVFWSEDFTTGAGWTLANVTGPEGSDPNPFYIGPWEGGGIPPGGCGVANNGNNTLHTGSVFNPTGGAAYDAGGLCGILYCPQTNRRAQSPVINCTGRSNITLSFNYIEFGSGSDDNMTVSCYTGGIWIQISDPVKTPCCGGACNGVLQGQWTSHSVILPANANNNPNVRIGFRWVNNDDGVGTDPSFAVDDITLTVEGPPESTTAEYFYSNPQVPYGNSLLPNLATISNCEYWNLTHDSGPSSRFVTLYFDGNSCGFQNNPANLAVANYNTGNWHDRGNGGSTVFSVTTAALQTVFGPYTLATVLPLPVELVTFDAKYNGKTVDLNWTTASEINNDYFTVERTKNGNDFLTIAKVRGAGTTITMHFYSANDDAPLNGVSYYRLMQTDFDGHNSFSKLVAVEINENVFGIDYLYASQDAGQIYFATKNISGDITIDVIDVLGRITISQKLFYSNENEILKINSSLLKTGVYILRVSNNGSAINKKFFY